MKKLILIFAGILYSISIGYSQMPICEVRPLYTHAVKKEKLTAAKLVSDLIPDYPQSWISDYVSVEVTSTCQGKPKKAVSTNEVLSKEQKSILSSADLATNIVISINYKQSNVVTNAAENRRIHIVYTVVPETEAEYVGGYSQLMHYLQETGIDKMATLPTNQLQLAIVRFTVDKAGRVTNVVLSESSGSAKIDQFLLDAIRKMPNWKPAVDKNGENVIQQFELRVGEDRTGC